MDNSPNTPNRNPKANIKKIKNDKRELVVYVAGLYSRNKRGGIANDKEKEENIQMARDAAVRLWEDGYTVICPHLNTTFFERDCNCSYEDYITGDLEIVKRCDIIYMLKGWELSPGALREFTLAKQLNKTILYEN